MGKNKSLIEDDKSLFNKFINFFKNLFTQKKTEEILENTQINDKQFDNNYEKNSNFLNDIQINQENPELLKLQKKFENKEIEMAELTDEQINQLNELYSRQIDVLEKTLANKKKELVNAQYTIQIKNSKG
jgi:hypothetical protein